jgi:hypothetical protein
VEVLDPEFMDKYYNYQIDQLRASVPASEFDTRAKQMQDEREMFSSPVIQFIVMFLSVFIVGFIVTIISTLVLKRNAVPKAVA